MAYTTLDNTLLCLASFQLTGISLALFILSIALIGVLIALLSRIVLKLKKQNRLIKIQRDQIHYKSAQLEGQNATLLALDKEKNTLISVVSHDLKSPFNRIYALTNLLKMTDDNLTDEQQEYLSKMHQVVKDGLSLIKNLLDIRALENKGIAKEIEKVDMIFMVKSLMKAQKPLADIKNIKLKYESNLKQLEVMTDKQYVSRIFDNVLSNAIKFSPLNKTVVVTVGNENGKTMIAVKDEGPGISEEDKKLMFGKYQVLSAKPTDGESSTGLGLSITKSLVGLLEGEIHCNSNLGEGAEFVVMLPTQD